MKDINKALTVLIACCLVLVCAFGSAFLRQQLRLSSADLHMITRLAVGEAVEEAIRQRGLMDAEGYVANRISSLISEMHHVGVQVDIVRRNDFDRFSAFFFDVATDDLSIRFWLDGTKDPLLAIRLGLDYKWREDPYHPYQIHGWKGILSDCLRSRYFHIADDGPDFFARLENRTSDPYRYGVETFLVVDGDLAIDHLLLDGRSLIDDAHRRYYGLD